MSVREKEFVPDRIYFVTFTIYKWINIFTNDKIISLVYKWFDYMRENYSNKIHGYVIMPNHIHMLLYVSTNSPTLSKLIQNGKRFLAYGIVKNLEEKNEHKLLKIFLEAAATTKGAKHKIFENRYDSKIMSNSTLYKTKLIYIHNNPCSSRWHLSEAPQDYKYSSASNYINGSGIYDVEIIN